MHLRSSGGKDFCSPCICESADGNSKDSGEGCQQRQTPLAVLHCRQAGHCADQQQSDRNNRNDVTDYGDGFFREVPNIAILLVLQQEGRTVRLWPSGF